MINRIDLTKKFELLSLQEMKNHNDSILATNVSINRLQSLIDNLSEKLDMQLSKVDGAYIYQSRLIDDLNDKFDIHKNRNQSMLNDFFVRLKDLEESLKKNDSELSNSFTKHEIHKDRLKGLESKFIDSSKIISKALSDLQCNITSVSVRARTDLEHAKSDILSMPSEAEKAKAELREEIAILKVDREGILKEIQVYKKETFVMQKKIENLYTLIERLEERIPK